MKSTKRIIAGLVALAAGLFHATHSHPAAPPARTQAPGYYRMMVSDLEITALSDGVVSLPIGKLLTKVTPQRVEEMLSRAFLKDPVPTSVNAYLVNTGSSLVMMDTGAGALFVPTPGKLVDSIKASGYQPEQVDEICTTHMHGDRVGGLVSGAKQFRDPGVTIQFDSGNKLAEEARRKVYADAAQGRFWIAVAHVSFPGIGRIRPEGSGHEYDPANYTTL